ncbi:MAG: protein-L-isoaspartate(D-aspartate) O-methyltransferase [Thermoanaerobaculia bacterium]|nr:protein-L-isoaspartate(D-aspartate) O-methyltransferase [Thermoanaerobaculia bacterium]
MRRWVAPLALALLCGPGARIMEAQRVKSPADLRREMVELQIRARGVSDAGVLAAMEEVPRHLFVPEAYRDRAYADSPQPIGDSQTISQPFIVALMTELLELDGSERVLEIGTGSGYQAAVLAELARDVYTIEIREELGERAKRLLGELGYSNVHFRIGDGHQGWPEEAPFDAIIVTAAPAEVPQALLDQLEVGGRLVIPVGDFWQNLEVITKRDDGYERHKVTPVRFVPMVTDPGR